MCSPLKTIDPYANGRLSINPDSKLKEPITSIQRAKSTWNNQTNGKPHTDKSIVCDAEIPSKSVRTLDPSVQAKIDQAHTRRLERELEKMEIKAENYAVKEKLRESERLRLLQAEEIERLHLRLLQTEDENHAAQTQKQCLQRRIQIRQPEDHKNEIRLKDTEIRNLQESKKVEWRQSLNLEKYLRGGNKY